MLKKQVTHLKDLYFAPQRTVQKKYRRPLLSGLSCSHETFITLAVAVTHSRLSRRASACSCRHFTGEAPSEPKNLTGYFIWQFNQCKGSGNHPQTPLPGKFSKMRDFPTSEYCQDIQLLHVLPEEIYRGTVHGYLGYLSVKN